MTLAALPNTFHSINCRWEVGIYFVLFIRFSPLDWKKIGKFQTDLSATWLIQRHKKNTHVIAQKIQQQNEQTTSTTNNSKIVKNNRAKKKKNTTHLSRCHSASVDIYFLFNFSNHEIILSFIRLFNESAFAITINLLNLALDRLLCIRCDFFFDKKPNKTSTAHVDSFLNGCWILYVWFHTFFSVFSDWLQKMEHTHHFIWLRLDIEN